MNRFLAGLVVGAVIGSTGTFCGLISMDKIGGDESGVTLPEQPFATVKKLNRFLDGCPYEVGFCAKHLKSDRGVERLADREVCLASMVKVFCLTELYRRKHEEGFDLNGKIDVPSHGLITFEKAASLMIGVSDNPCTHALAEFLGRDKVNAIPCQLGIKSMSANILPTEKDLHSTLDIRIKGERVAAPDLPMHGTARGLVEYYELLLKRQVISRDVSNDLLNFYSRHSKAFSNHFTDEFFFAGKGGNILWTRPPKHFSCMGWGIFGENAEKEQVSLSVWGEWFPKEMPPDKQMEFLKFVTDSVLLILE